MASNDVIVTVSGAALSMLFYENFRSNDNQVVIKSNIFTITKFHPHQLSKIHWIRFIHVPQT